MLSLLVQQHPGEKYIKTENTRNIDFFLEIRLVTQQENKREDFDVQQI
jgi:hypothetical protein